MAASLYRNSKHNSKRYWPETYNLTQPFIRHLYEKQGGKCAYSGEELQFCDADKYHKITLDRIDPQKGYTKDNVCLCTWFVNMMKNNCPMDQFRTIIKNINDTINP